MIVSCCSYLDWILLNTKNSKYSGKFVSVSFMVDDKKEKLYKMHYRGHYLTLSLKFIFSPAVVTLIKFFLYGEGQESHLFSLS